MGTTVAHSHSHSHSSGRTHTHGAGTGRRRLTGALAVTLGIFILQIIGAVLTGSLALLFDTVHVLTDAAGLALALFAAVLSERPASHTRTWGFKRVEILAAALQSAVLIGVGIFVIVEAIRRLIEPAEVVGQELVVFGAVGLLGNVIAIIILFGGQKDGQGTLNLRAAFLEVLNDALGSLAVILSAVIIWTTGWMPADSLTALLIGLLIIPRALRILRESVSVLLETTPPGLDLEQVREHIEAQDHVVRVHDLHASRISTDLPILTAHVVLEDRCFEDGHSAELLCGIQACIAEHFEVSIQHSTIQLEPRSHYAHEHPEFSL